MIIQNSLIAKKKTIITDRGVGRRRGNRVQILKGRPAPIHCLFSLDKGLAPFFFFLNKEN